MRNDVFEGRIPLTFRDTGHSPSHTGVFGEEGAGKHRFGETGHDPSLHCHPPRGSFWGRRGTRDFLAFRETGCNTSLQGLPLAGVFWEEGAGFLGASGDGLQPVSTLAPHAGVFGEEESAGFLGVSGDGLQPVSTLPPLAGVFGEEGGGKKQDFLTFRGDGSRPVSTLAPPRRSFFGGEGARVIKTRKAREMPEPCSR